MSRLIPNIHRDIGINCATSVNGDFEKIFLCYLINKHTKENNWSSHIFSLAFEEPPTGAIFFTEVKLGNDILTHKIYWKNNVFYIVRNF